MGNGQNYSSRTVVVYQGHYTRFAAIAGIYLSKTAGGDSKIRFFTKWVQNRPFDILRPRIDVEFYARSHGSNENVD